MQAVVMGAAYVTHSVILHQLQVSKVRDVRLAVAQPNCPPHPIPLPLPSPFPTSIQETLRVVEGELKAVINTTSLVSIHW